MSISAVAGASSFTPPVSQNQALQAKAAGVGDHDGGSGAKEAAASQAKETPKLSPPVNTNRGRNLDVVA